MTIDIDHVVAAYAMTNEDKLKLTNMLAQAYLQAKIQAYQRAQKTAGHVLTLHDPWKPDEQAQRRAHIWANWQVTSIASTYEELLRSQLESDTQEAIGDVVRGIVSKVKKWISGFLPWKTQQIADYTVSAGDNAGTSQWIDDVLGGVDGDTGKVRARVLPGESSNDLCKQYAGNDYSLEEANDLPNFPIHSNCPHYVEIYTVGE